MTSEDGSVPPRSMTLSCLASIFMLSIAILLAVQIRDEAFAEPSYGGYHSTFFHLPTLNASSICLAYGGTCTQTIACATTHLYGLYHHSILACNDTRSIICCLSQFGFRALYGNKHHGSSRRSSHHRRRRSWK